MSFVTRRNTVVTNVSEKPAETCLSLKQAQYTQGSYREWDIRCLHYESLM
jgi:hypothetical protein